MKTTHPFEIFRFLVITTFLLQSVMAQTTRPDRTQPTQYAAFKPSVSAIIVVLVTLLFFLAFFSIYVRHCSNTVFTPLAANNRSRGNATRGLDASLIETLPIFMYSEVKGLKIGKGALECAVCLNEFEDDESLRLLPKCDHVFHPECIDEWLSSHTTCPVCRANIAEPDTVEETTSPVSDSVTADGDDRGRVAIEVAEESVADDGGSDANREMIWSKFPRSHSTGHSLVQSRDNTDRFTLKLPVQIRNEIMTRALNRTTSLVVLRREYGATSGGEGSSGRKSYRRLGSLDRPDRWMFTMAPPFVGRESSMKKSNRSGSGSEGSGSSKRFNLIGRLSFNRFGGSKRSEPELIVKGSNSNSSSSPV